MSNKKLRRALRSTQIYSRMNDGFYPVFHNGNLYGWVFDGEFVNQPRPVGVHARLGLLGAVIRNRLQGIAKRDHDDFIAMHDGYEILPWDSFIGHSDSLESSTDITPGIWAVTVSIGLLLAFIGLLAWRSWP